MAELSESAASVRSKVEPCARRTLAEVYGLPADGVEWAWQDFDARFPWYSMNLAEIPRGPVLGRKSLRNWAKSASNIMAQNVTEVMAAMLALEAQLWRALHPPGRPALRVIDGGTGGGSSGGGSAA